MGDADAVHEFSALNTLLLVIVLGLCIMSAYLIKKYRFYYLPESAAAMLVGLVVGGMARLIYPSREELQFLTFEPELFFFLLLPPIIFEAGYTLRKKQFFSNFWTIVMYAVLGTLVSTFIVGFATYGMGKMGLVTIDTSSPMEALLFGALISAVDPVATLSIMGSKELNCDPLLYSLVFGESVLNDAVAIVLFHTFYGFYDAGRLFTSGTFPNIMISFTLVSIGSICTGILIGLICAYLCKHTNIRDYPAYEVSLLFLFAYGSYAFAEAVELSGIMSLFFCGIVLSHYNSYNLSRASQVTCEAMFKGLATVSEFFVFLYMGMGVFTGRFTQWNLFFIIMATLFCLVARVFNTFPFSFLANLARVKKIPFKMQVVIWFAGLRGAIAFALAQNMPENHRALYATTTLSIVMFTTVVNGGLTEPMLTRMGMKTTTEAPSSNGVGGSGNSAGRGRSGSGGTEVEMGYDSQPYEQLVPQSEHGAGGSSGRREDSADTGLQAHWRLFDQQYMKPFFGGRTEETEGSDISDDEDDLEVDSVRMEQASRRHGHGIHHHAHGAAHEMTTLARGDAANANTINSVSSVAGGSGSGTGNDSVA